MTDLRAGAQQALEALESSRIFVTTREKTKHPEGTEWYDSAITALRTALEQPEPDLIPQDKLFVCGQMGANITRVTAQPGQVDCPRCGHVCSQRPWQGLTDEEIWSAVSRIGTADLNVNPLIILSDARAIEAKLKGKNYDTART